MSVSAVASVMGMWAIDSACIALLAWMIIAVARRLSAAQQHVVWLFSIVAMLALPLLDSTLPKVAWRVLPARPLLVARDVPAVLNIPSKTPASPASAAPADATTALPTAMQSPPQPREMGWLLPCAWLLGVVLVLLRASCSDLHWRGRLHRSREAVPPAPLLTEAAQVLGGNSIPRMVEIAELRVPVAFGWLRPVVALPAEWKRWPEARLSAVLRHEFAHVRRRDCAVQWIVTLATAMYWWHPAMWISARALRNARERACDDMVIESGMRPSEYAGSLVEVAVALHQRVEPGVAMANGGPLEKRVRAIVSAASSRRTAGPIFKIFAAILAAEIAISFAMIRLDAAEPAPVPENKPSAFGRSNGMPEGFLETRIDFISVPNAEAAQVLLQTPEPAAQLERLINLAKAGNGKNLGEMTMRSMNGAHEQFKGIATVDVESATSEDSKSIGMNLQIVMGGATLITSSVAGVGEQTLAGAMSDPEHPKTGTLFIFAKADLAGEAQP